MKTQTILLILTVLLSGCGPESVPPALPSGGSSISTPEGAQMQEREGFAHVTANTSVEVINHLIDDVNAGNGFLRHLL